MTIHTVTGARGGSMLRSLAAIGLIRVLAEQADKDLRCRFVGEDLEIDSVVEDLAAWLVDEYRPRPILSPWNEGSGFGAKDKTPKATLDKLFNLQTERLEPLRSAYRIVAPIAQTARTENWPKGRLVRTIRNSCPDDMLPWLNAAVIVLGDGDLAFPPLLGSGGNDGRLEFSTNFHQRLLEALPGNEKARHNSLTSAYDLINGTSTGKLSVGASGQFDPSATGTPNSSTFGSADGLVNPWGFILMVEGAVCFAAAPARRLSTQAGAVKRAAMTFTTYGSALGTASGSDTEDSRGEVWIPSWNHWLSYQSVGRIFSEGRAVWRSRNAVRSSDMYLSIGSLGVDSAVTAFDRFGLIKRNGLAFAAVRTDTVLVHQDEVLLLVADFEDWINRMESSATLPATVRRHVRAFGTANVELARSSTGLARGRWLQVMLSSLTRAEIAVGHGTRTKDDIAPRTPPSSRSFLALLDGPLRGLLDEPEFRVALGFASITSGAAPGGGSRSFREYVLPLRSDRGRPQWSVGPVIEGFPARPLADICADILVRHLLDATPSADTDSQPMTVGFRSPGSAVPVAAGDLHAYARGVLDAEKIQEWVEALIAFDWRHLERAESVLDHPGLPLIPDPHLSMLLPFCTGVEYCRNPVAGTAVYQGPRIGLTTEIAVRLARGHASNAVTIAKSRLRQLGYGSTSNTLLPHRTAQESRRLAAAILPRCASPQGDAVVTYRLSPEPTAREDLS